MLRRKLAALAVAISVLGGLLLQVPSVLADPAMSAPALAPTLTREEFESEFFSGLTGFLGYAGNRTLAVNGSIGGRAARFTATGLLEPDGTSELAIGTADGRRIQQLCVLEPTDEDGGTAERCVDRMAPAGSDTSGRPWFPAAESPFETSTAVRLGERILAAMDADIATLRSPVVELSGGGGDSGLVQRLTASAGGTTIAYDIGSTEEAWTVVSTRNGVETGRLSLAPASASIGTAYPAGETFAPRMAVWENLGRIAGVLDRSIARRGAIPTARVPVPSADAPDAVYRVCVRTVKGRPAYTILGTQPGSPYHWRRSSGTRAVDVTAYANPEAGRLPECSIVRGRNGPVVTVR